MQARSFRHSWAARAVRDDLHAAMRGQDGCLPPDVAKMSCLLWRSVRPALPACRAGPWSVASGTTGAVGVMGRLMMVAPAIGRVSPGAGQPGQRWDQGADGVGDLHG